jgi:hypothetical protein
MSHLRHRKNLQISKNLQEGRKCPLWERVPMQYRVCPKQSEEIVQTSGQDHSGDIWKFFRCLRWRSAGILFPVKFSQGDEAAKRFLIPAMLRFMVSMRISSVRVSAIFRADSYPCFGFCPIERRAAIPAIYAFVEWTRTRTASTQAIVLQMGNEPVRISHGLSSVNCVLFR